MKTLTVFAIILGLAAGCQTAHVAEPLTGKYGGADADAQMEFWHQLADRPVTCNDEAFHGLLLYLDGKDDNADYAARISSMKSRSLLPGDFHAPANDAVSRGVLAVAISRALQIKGGVMLHVARTSPRYATRELMFMDLYPPSSPNQTFSGAEFLGIMGRVEDWQRGNAADVPAAVLPNEMKQ
ncbi:MAG TPA: hypothetical protein VHD56_13280 [Tepidisphaeraceae bacterium]|nr:hypothetical protein [Tepidisphaeraceae bacterium]